MMSKTCPECSIGNGPSWSVDSDDDLAEVLSHYLQEHPESDRLTEVVDKSYVAQVCNDCETGFWAVAHIGHDDRAKITTDAFCPDCDGEGVRQLIVRTIHPSEYVAKHAEPFDDDLNEVLSA